MSAVFDPKDGSRTTPGKTYNLVRKHTRPPQDMPFGWITREMLESHAIRSLTGNAYKAFLRIWLEHIQHGGLHNGRLIVTHEQFADYGVTNEYVADAVEELDYKGLIRIRRGRAGAGIPHANVYRLTFLGDYEGAPATNDWQKVDMEKCRRWTKIDRKLAAEKRGKIGRKKKSPLRDSEILPLRDSEILGAR